jgi:hypothetical protein
MDFRGKLIADWGFELIPCASRINATRNKWREEINATLFNVPLTPLVEGR